MTLLLVELCRSIGPKQDRLAIGSLAANTALIKVGDPKPHMGDKGNIDENVCAQPGWKTTVHFQAGRLFIAKQDNSSLPGWPKTTSGNQLPLALISARGNFGSLMLVLTIGRQKFTFKLWCGVERLAAKQFEVAQTRIDVSERNWELWLGRLGLREKSLTL